MPNKTIYVRDEDISLFEEAERLGGDSLSGIITEALRRFVAVKRAEMFGMREHALPVGVLRSQGDDDIRQIRFVGRLLAEAEVLTDQTSPRDRDGRGTDYKIYQTQAGRILVWWKRWTRWEGGSDFLDYAVMSTLPGYDDEISGKVHGEHLPPETLPGSLLQAAAEALGEELVEWVE
ncbi:hypothetical protein [Candidatus Darwinibacter acetoxidans]